MLTRSPAYETFPRSFAGLCIDQTKSSTPNHDDKHKFSNGRCKLYGRKAVIADSYGESCPHSLFSFRNAARIRSKDVTGRAQKGHFMKQRHQILLSGLQGNDQDRSFRNQSKIEDIGLAHARKDIMSRLPSKSKMMNYSSQSPTKIPTASSSENDNKIRSSKILESLDINERVLLGRIYPAASANCSFQLLHGVQQ